MKASCKDVEARMVENLSASRVQEQDNRDCDDDGRDGDEKQKTIRLVSAASLIFHSRSAKG